MNGRWPTKTLAEACQIKPPKSEARDKLTETDLVSFLPMEAMGIDQMLVNPAQEKPLGEVAGSYTYFAEGDVLLAKITPCFENGKLGIASGLKNGIGFGSSEYIVFRPNHSISKEWLYYFLLRESFRIEGAERMSGAVGHKRVSKEFIEDCRIPAPPLAEQQRLISILHEAFAGIATAKANAEKNLQNARELFESNLNSALTQKGEGWPEKRLEEVADKYCTLSYGIVQPGNEYPDGLPVVRPTDLTEKIITSGGLKRINPKLADGYRRTVLRGGELLLCVRGATGVVSVASTDLVGANVTRGIVPILFDGKQLTQEFGYYLMASATVQAQIREKTYGTALMQINIRDLRKITLSFPDLNEQAKMTGQFDALFAKTRRLESIYQQKLIALAELKQSLLRKAFSGKLTSDTVQ